MGTLYRKDEAKRSGEWGTQLTTRTLSINRVGRNEDEIDLSLQRLEFGRPAVNVTYILKDPEEALEIATALLKATGKNYQTVEVTDDLVTHEPFNGGREYYCGEGMGRVSVNDRHLTPKHLRDRAASLLRIADVMEGEEKAENEVSKRRNEVAEHLGWGRYDSLTIAERRIIQSIIGVENTKKENK